MNKEEISKTSIKKFVIQKQDGWTRSSRTISLRVTEKVYSILKEYCVVNKRTTQEVLEEAIVAYFDKESSVNNNLGGKK